MKNLKNFEKFLESKHDSEQEDEVMDNENTEEQEDYDDEEYGEKPGEPKGHSDKTGEAGRGRPDEHKG